LDRVPDRVVPIYLEDWQMRMVKDALGVDCHVWFVPVGPSPGSRYGVMTSTSMRTSESANAGDRRPKRMYLTTWQKEQIRDEFGVTCNFVELEPDIIVKYGMPPK